MTLSNDLTGNSCRETYGFIHTPVSPKMVTLGKSQRSCLSNSSPHQGSGDVLQIRVVCMASLQSSTQCCLIQKQPGEEDQRSGVCAHSAEIGVSFIKYHRPEEACQEIQTVPHTGLLLLPPLRALARTTPWPAAAADPHNHHSLLCTFLHET